MPNLQISNVRNMSRKNGKISHRCNLANPGRLIFGEWEKLVIFNFYNCKETWPDGGEPQKEQRDHYRNCSNGNVALDHSDLFIYPDFFFTKQIKWMIRPNNISLVGGT